MGATEGKVARLRSESGDRDDWDDGGKKANWEIGTRWITTEGRADVDDSAGDSPSIACVEPCS